jgi:hypothetical protein
LINYLDQKYEFISNCQKKLKLAFAYEGLIQIYDLRYGLKLSPLDRYQCIIILIIAQITSIAFDSKGS